MGSKSLPLHDNGIFRNLPTFSSDLKDLTAIVTGANGISGFHTMRVLLQSPQRWKKVYSMSRRPPPKEMMDLLPAEQRSRVEHVACDFLSKPEDIAKAMKGQNVTADYIFFYSYLQPKPDPGSRAWSNADALVETNGALLRNFLGALALASIVPKRFVLQTGAKNYGVHLGPALGPAVESDPRVLIEPNFYYPQEDALFEYCKKNKTAWNVIRPAWIIGAVRNAQMNPLHPLAVYAAVQAKRKLPVAFPGSLDIWQQEHTHATAFLTGYLTEWAALESHTADHAFNATDTALTTWARFWPELARWYGAPYLSHGPPVEQDPAKFTTTVTLPYDPPPIGYGPPGHFRASFTFTGWAQDPENHEAWKEIMKEHGLDHDPFEDVEAHFTFADASTWVLGKINLSMTKARRMGWTGFVDTTESTFLAFSEMSKLGMLPPPVVEAAKPNV